MLDTSAADALTVTNSKWATDRSLQGALLRYPMADVVKPPVFYRWVERI